VAEGAEAVGRFELDTDDDGLVIGGVYVRVFGNQVRELQVAWGAGPSPALLAQFEAAGGSAR